MASDSAPVSSQLHTSADHSDQGSNSFRILTHFEPQCLVCRRYFSLDAVVDEGFEAMCICRDCKNTVLADNQPNTATRDVQRRRRRHRTAELVEDSFSRRFSQLINLANQNNGSQTESGTPVAVRQSRHYYTTHSRSQRRQRAFSDNDSDGFDLVDSVFSESDSFASFGGNGGESDTSMDRHSIVDRELNQLENEIYESTDSDIDPMHVGLSQWNYDEQYDEDADFDEADFDQARAFVETHQQFADNTVTPRGTSRGDSDYSAWVRTVNDTPDIRYTDLFSDFDQSRRRRGYVGNPGDYVDARGFEELLEQLAEADNTRRGAPPASASYVASLPSISISEDHEKNGNVLICAVCKDMLDFGTEAKQLPCMHLYHPPCIFPWLRARNSCPVCRFELPTDDSEYEMAKRNLVTESTVAQRFELSEETIYGTDTEVDEAHDTYRAIVREDGPLSSDTAPSRPNEGGGRGRWLFLAAAPLVSVVGIVLVLCFRKPLADRRIQANIPSSRFATRSSDGNRRWWSIF